jgi:prepilin-type N-terminal cleavage/methylation domain-containing protein
MRFRSHLRGQNSPRNSLQSDRAFSLIELMVAVTILSLLFLLAVPTYQRIQRKAKAAAIANDLRVFAAVFQAHAHEAGGWPPETAAGIVPLGLTADELKFDDWTQKTPMGGKFDWEYNQTHVGVQYHAAIAITPTADAPVILDDELLLEIDKAIDDGDLSAGVFRRGNGNYPLFIIEN